MYDREKKAQLARLVDAREKKRREQEWAPAPTQGIMISKRDGAAFFLFYILFIFALAGLIFSLGLMGNEPKESEAGAQIAAQLVQAQAVDYRQEEPEETEEPDEDAKIEAALLASGYYREDIPLTFEEQEQLHFAAEESGIRYELALGVIDAETDFRNITGDNGNSFGYMQVQPYWHGKRMERLGVTDLMDPASNFRVGCDYLSELIVKYGDLTDALTAYSSGDPGDSEYAREVLAAMEEFKG